MFISEAVLFYVNPQAIKNIFDEVFAFGQQTEAMYGFTDSMRPFVEGAPPRPKANVEAELGAIGSQLQH